VVFEPSVPEDPEIFRIRGYKPASKSDEWFIHLILHLRH
jgi:hypothetical protein